MTNIVFCDYQIDSFLENPGREAGMNPESDEIMISAMTTLAASLGWNASQNTYSERLEQRLEFGRHRPPSFLSTLQQEALPTFNP